MTVFSTLYLPRVGRKMSNSYLLFTEKGLAYFLNEFKVFDLFTTLYKFF